MSPTDEPPLCVDLDGTLIRGDTTWLSIFLLATRKPWLLPGAPIALLRGRAALKEFLSEHVLPEPERLHWRSSVVEFVRGERRRGRRVILCTAAHRRIADAAAHHLGLFDDVLATEVGHNLKSAAKLDGIRKFIGAKEFDYIGDARADLPVFAAARCAYLVAPTASLLADTRAIAHVEAVFDSD
jgi:phosphoserine phosphatase